MDKVALCVEELSSLPEVLEDQAQLEIISKKISKLEHEADLTKNDIRNHLPSNLFLPIAKGALLEILSLQDSIADKAEDIAITLTLHPLEKFQGIRADFVHFFEMNVKSIWMVRDVISELKEILEASFGGNEAQKVNKMIEEIAKKEHEIDILQYSLIKKLYSCGNTFSPPAFHLWLSVVKEVGALSDIAEKLANRIRMILEIK